MTPDELKNLDEAIVKFKHFVLTGESGGAAMTYPMEQAARTLSQLMHGTHPDFVLSQRLTINLGKNIGGYVVTGYEAATRKDEK